MGTRTPPDGFINVKTPRPQTLHHMVGAEGCFCYGGNRLMSKIAAVTEGYGTFGGQRVGVAVALETYRNKRKFGVTPEPRGRPTRRGGNRFVIQKHAARRLHYDLRLELDGVMKSWAVTRGPSLDPADKRLAVHVEDHPVEYNTFEGTIPDGEYGGGTVMIWDRGTWHPEGDPHKGYAKGHLVFDLDGEKLHGRWHLVRMHRRPNERHDNWLLIKAKDGEARSARQEDILAEAPNSAASGRTMEEIAGLKGKKRVWHSNRKGADEPEPRSQQSFKEELRALATEIGPARRGAGQAAVTSAGEVGVENAKENKLARRRKSGTVKVFPGCAKAGGGHSRFCSAEPRHATRNAAGRRRVAP